MSRTKLSLLACTALLMLGAGFANSALAADTQASDTLANDLMKIQGTVGGDETNPSPDATPEKNAASTNGADQALSVLSKETPDTPKPAKKSGGKQKKDAPAEKTLKAATQDPAPDTSAAPLLQPETTQSPDISQMMAQPAASVPTPTDVKDPTSTQTLLDQIAAEQNEIILLKLKNEHAALQESLDKITGVAQQRAAAAQAAAAPVVEKSEPEDKPENLPGVSAIFGAKGEKKVELSLPSGGTVVAKIGDVLPGGWKLSKIDDTAVYVTSQRTSKEFVLGAGRSGGAAISTQSKSKRTSKTTDDSGEKPNVVLAPAK